MVRNVNSDILGIPTRLDKRTLVKNADISSKAIVGGETNVASNMSTQERVCTVHKVRRHVVSSTEMVTVGRVPIVDSVINNLDRTHRKPFHRQHYNFRLTSISRWNYHRMKKRNLMTTRLRSNCNRKNNRWSQHSNFVNRKG